MHRRIAAVLGVLAVAAVAAAPASANHAWGNYHWARTANPFTLTVVDSNTPDWDDNLGKAMADWGKSTVLDLRLGAADDAMKTRKRCPMVSGMIRSCNASYGYNGWLGLATINVTGGTHITQASTKMNDSYLSSPSYSETNRQHVMCQETGHDFGLDHQDESGADLNTCMDYSSALDNPTPNQHDYDELVTIYSHLDSTTTVAGAATLTTAADRGEQPVAVDRVDRLDSSVVTEHFADGSRRITHILWAIGGPGTP
ncbi:MAG: hypothetical protein ACM33B_12010 [Pseudomonadota bacterium]